MGDNGKFNYGIGTRFGNGKACHQPGWEYYARKAEAERDELLQNAKVVLKEKRIKAGNTLYTFTIKQSKSGKPYLVISGNVEKISYRGSIVVFAPYMPDFLRVLQQVSKMLE